jgi:hypothetical protein
MWTIKHLDHPPLKRKHYQRQRTFHLSKPIKTKSEQQHSHKKEKRNVIQQCFVLTEIISSLIPEDLIAPSKDPIGVRLLRLMGWREGKGIGPRKKRAPPKKTTEKKVYGAALPPGLAAIKENEADDVPEDEKPQIVITSSETQFDSVKTNTIENQNEDDTYDPYAENFTFAPENGTHHNHQQSPVILINQTNNKSNH